MPTPEPRDGSASGAAPTTSQTELSLSLPGRLSEQLNAWRRPTEAMAALFAPYEIERLAALRPQAGPETRSVILPSWENPFARVGLAATLPLVGEALQEHARAVLHVSPLHSGLANSPRREQLRRLRDTSVRFAGTDVPMHLYEVEQDGSLWILFTAPGFFTADGGKSRRDPYAYPNENLAEQQGAGSLLLRDSLFASKALPKILSELGYSENLIVHVNDWQFASCALTVKEAQLEGVIESAATVLTMHTPLDHSLPTSRLTYITPRTDPRSWPAVGSPQGRERETVLERMVPLLDAPVITGGMFAQELIADPLQTQYLVPHLQGVLREQTVLGISHGPAADVPQPFGAGALSRVQDGDCLQLLNEKLALRRALLELIENDQYARERCIGSWSSGDNQPITRLGENVPIFVMIGLPDPSQNAFDVFSRAIVTVPPGRNRYAFIPSVTQGGAEMLRELSALAEARPGEVLVFPDGLEGRAYETFLAGATWGVMANLYAPFGSALDFYARGTPVVARATGGLREQVVDVDASPDEATGVLFEEKRLGQPQWQALLKDSAVHGRDNDPLFRAMRESLAAALARAGHISSEEPAAYAEILSHLPGRLAAFPWRESASQLAKIYDRAGRT